MKIGDIIVEFDGKKVVDALDLPLWIARTPIDTSVPVKVQRERKEVQLQLTLRSLPDGHTIQSRGDEIG